MMKRSLAIFVGTLALAALSPPGPAASDPEVTVVMSGLDSPRGLAFGPEGALYVAEGGRGPSDPSCFSHVQECHCIVQFGQPFCSGPTGAVTRLWKGSQKRIATGFPSLAGVSGAAQAGPNDISFVSHNRAFVTIGLQTDPAYRALLGEVGAGFGQLVRMKANGKWRFVADVASYEAAENPDDGIADSNPYGLLARPVWPRSGDDDDGDDDGDDGGDDDDDGDDFAGKLAFRRSTPGTPANQSEIWMMNADGTNETQVTCNTRDDISSAWSPNGKTIAFYSAQVVGGLPTQFLYLIDVKDGCGPGTLLTEGRFPRWSPNGKKIVFDRGRLGVRDVFVRNLKDGTEENLTNDAAARNLRGDFSPNGKKIVFARGAGEDKEDIWVMKDDGSDKVQLTFHPAGDNAPKWSPDGKQILFQSDRDGNDEIYVMDADGSNQTRLTFRAGQDATPDWSPNGQKIVFHGSVPPNLQLFIMNADGSDVTQVTGLPTSSAFPDWVGGRVQSDQDDEDDDAEEQRNCPEGTADETEDGHGGRAVLTDAGGNSLLRVDKNGDISTLAVFPSRGSNPPRPSFAPPPFGPFTDAVPTSVVVGPDGAYYVGELTGVPFTETRANVYRLNPCETPRLFRLEDACLTGFKTIIDMAFDRQGNLYVLQHATGPVQLMGPGVLIRVTPDKSQPDICARYQAGTRTTVLGGLTRPTSIAIGRDGALYVTNRGVSVGLGEVLRIEP